MPMHPGHKKQIKSSSSSKKKDGGKGDTETKSVIPNKIKPRTKVNYTHDEGKGHA